MSVPERHLTGYRTSLEVIAVSWLAALFLGITHGAPGRRA